MMIVAFTQTGSLAIRIGWSEVIFRIADADYGKGIFQLYRYIIFYFQVIYYSKFNKFQNYYTF